MAYKCIDCGHIFEDGEEITWKESHGFNDGFSETFSVCPVCKGDYKKTTPCKQCGSEHFESELYEGVCEECLKEFVTYDKALEYLINGDLLATFMFEKVWENPAPSKASDKLQSVLRELFLRYKANDLLCDKTDFIDMCQQYIIDDDGEYGKINFAEWLNEREVK